MGREHDGGSHHASEERPAAYFIHACDISETARTQVSFMRVEAAVRAGHLDFDF
jgi:hypothetical protein